ncbi:MAG TPA: mechanosensitive ion channel family protein [Kofleriaceae bacterium]
MEEYYHRVTQSPAFLAIAAFALTAVVAYVVTRLLRSVVNRIARRTTSSWDDALAAHLVAPVAALMALQGFGIALDWLQLRPHNSNLFENSVNMLTIGAVVWAAFRMIDLSRRSLEHRSWARVRPASRSLLSLGSRFAKVAAFVLALLVALSQLGVSIASLIAGLGLGGLVFALAAQKTVENVFGAVSIGIDQPMREGDFVKVGDFMGTVEQIGLRSTRIRTLERTVVTIPNGDLSQQRIESFALRDRMRFTTLVGLQYGTTAAQMKEILAGFEAALRAQPQLWKDDLSVRFKALGPSSLDVEVQAWFMTTAVSEFTQIRQDLLLAFIAVVEQAGAQIAFPTQTLHVASVPSASEPPRDTPSLAG